MHRILSPAERSALKARAHPLRPVVMIGSEGLSAGVLQEIDASLNAHELIKIRIDNDDPDEREDVMGAICANTGASAVQHIGKTLVVFRERPQGNKARNEAPPARGRKRANAAEAPRKAGARNARAGAKAGAKNAAGGNRSGGAAAKSGGKSGQKSGQVWSKVRTQRPRRNKAQQGRS